MLTGYSPNKRGEERPVFREIADKEDYIEVI